MRRAVCPGSFDPVHKGHIEIIARAANLFDEVIVAVSTNYSKKHLFTEDERVDIIAECVGGLRGVSVEPMGQGLLAEFCRERGAESIVKGLRSLTDYQYEVPMATMNRHLTGVETVFLQGDQSYAHVSSSLIKEVHQLGGDISDFVPSAVLKRLEARR
ncbi:pantetheine-phosphate adenylyltransferase [Neomicrococcus aestuarii]|uniref:Phosphopantetheine adenylyltransferase n=1 Tax=Neomicrococcus aestuarii TaxID=556325 RepID=A0A7W8TSM9_9MICC|nr:pantetheine-phosphate adenylyltransferase [Neomicrococcus aestuarii]MBB5512175.1 pantetheine-phosphate adenylyltransferase [Neomicrococcus aestuarii]